MRTTVDIDANLLKRLRAEAHRRGVSLKEVLAGALRRGLEGSPTAKQTRYRCPTFRMGAVAESLDLDKALAIASALEDDETVRELAARK
jgi:hypothetical protein